MTTIKPQNTAISRKVLSAPLRLVLDACLVPKSGTFLDFGCGRGDDVRILTDMGRDAVGYDPYQKGFEDMPEGKFDTVLLTYVLNTVPETTDRWEIINQAWAKVKPGGVLVVSTRDEGEMRSRSHGKNWRRYNDGFITSESRGTFQAGISQEELVDLGHQELSDLWYVSCPEHRTSEFATVVFGRAKAKSGARSTRGASG